MYLKSNKLALTCFIPVTTAIHFYRFIKSTFTNYVFITLDDDKSYSIQERNQTKGNKWIHINIHIERNRTPVVGRSSSDWHRYIHIYLYATNKAWTRTTMPPQANIEANVFVGIVERLSLLLSCFPKSRGLLQTLLILTLQSNLKLFEYVWKLFLRKK